MYAVIRAGGKQYRVTPGDVIRLEKQAADAASLEFELLAVGDGGKISRPEGEARVTGEIVEEGRAKKVLVFHYKRKKQYKKLAGHRQPFTAVRITEIAYDGQSQKAPELPVKARKQTEGGAAPEGAVKPKKKAGKKPPTSGPAAGAGSKTANRHGGSSKG